jgi:RNA polymerase sigma-70 factor (sigma-E family)
VTSVEQQFSEFATLAAPRLRRTAFLLCGDWHTAEDLAQTALAKVFVSWRRISRKDAAQAYATRTLVNSYLADRRHKRATEVLLRRLPDRAVPPPAPELRLVVLGALAALPPRSRAVVVLRYWEDLSVEQVADLLGCSAGNVKSQSARGLDKLRALLADDAPTPGPVGPNGARPAPRRRPAQPPPAQTRGAPHG